MFSRSQQNNGSQHIIEHSPAEMIALPGVSEGWQVAERIPRSFKRAEAQYVSSPVSLFSRTRNFRTKSDSVLHPCPAIGLLLSWVSEGLLLMVLFTVVLFQQQWERNHRLVPMEPPRRSWAVAGFARSDQGCVWIDDSKWNSLKSCNCGSADELCHLRDTCQWPDRRIAGKQVLWLAGCALCVSQRQGVWKVLLPCKRASNLLYWLT